MTHEQRVTVVNEVLEILRPAVMNDGGNIEFVKLEHNTVYIRFIGACVGCPSSIFTLKFGVEQAIKERLPEIEEVLPIE